MSSSEKQYPVQGLCVLDLSQTLAGAYASKMLSDVGGEVIIVEPPGGDHLRHWKKSALLGLSDPLSPGEDGALFHYLHGNKKSVVIDKSSEIDQQRLADLCAGADLVICDSRSGLLASYHLDSERLRANNPRLSIVEISAYGRDEPGVATEFTLQAEVGSTDSRGYADRLPVAAGGQLGEYLVASFTAVAALTAWLRAREQDKGQDVDLSMFESILLSFQTYQYVHQQLEPGVPFPREVEVPSVEPSKDGWVGFCTITAQQWQALSAMIESPELAGLSSQKQRFEQIDRVLEAVHRWTRERTTEEILQVAEQYRVPAVPVGDGESVFGMSHLQQRQVFETNPAGFQQPRVPYHFSDSLTRSAGAAPKLGQCGGADFEPRKTRENNGEPLRFDAVRVVDLTAFWAGPIVTAYLAGLGAEVIKVESVARPDGMRFASGFFPKDTPLWESSGVVHGANSGKYGLTLDMSTAAGLDLLKELIKTADIVIENFSPRVMDKYGLGWEQVQALNSRAIMVRMPAFGLDGPWRDRTGFAMNIEQVSGMAAFTGYADRAPLVPRGCVDPLGGMQAAFATLCALHARQESGKGQLIEVPLLETGLGVAAEPIVEYSAYGARLGRMGNRAANSLQAILACNDGRLIALAIEDHPQLIRLMELLAIAQPRSFRRYRAADWLQHESDIVAMLQEYFANCEAETVLTVLQENQFAVALLYNARELLFHPRLARRSFFAKLGHRAVGPIHYPSFPFKFNGEYLPVSRAAPCLGEHNQEILGGVLGLSDDEIAQLRSDGVIGERPSFC
ncbi:MAG: CoA transferase [Gammaproteobacteria bacterium]|jgi:crotonobetainyl-CoA:carnitine CoA-transferase CaiB-like acyl-CoA transferase|nr:CoA transferase [Gammaproteobacteria bacterium]MBP6053558.1 CoA transferase [Pseudomonadales bacterium]MBK6583210.1 CoA transferase [Gammaproteobacteria bacterium]MBK7519344.1 CoA transferase [Gammaproteobacteria bacterium]MBK7729909.1 CoA transferase [Gammaproteobacteria bacterium]